MNRSKRKPESHIIGEEAVKLIKSRLPIEWTIRELIPDYGIDLDIELFEKSSSLENPIINYDTLGEHLFIQVKGTKIINTQKFTVKQRKNVEVYPVINENFIDFDENVIDVVVFDIETSELVTVQRMGAAMPMLLFLVEITSSRIFYVCLNDYIDKVILPEDPDYSIKGNKRIHIPIKNEITEDPDSISMLRFYAKRSKYYAAFQKFNYQKTSLDYVLDEDLIKKSIFFAKILLRYDFWTSKEAWAPIKIAHKHLKNLVDHSCPDIFESNLFLETERSDNSEMWTSAHSGNKEYSGKEMYVFMQIRTLWNQLVNLGDIYEDVCREWKIPTYLGVLTSDLK